MRSAILVKIWSIISCINEGAASLRAQFDIFTAWRFIRICTVLLVEVSNWKSDTDEVYLLIYIFFFYTILIISIYKRKQKKIMEEWFKYIWTTWPVFGSSLLFSITNCHGYWKKVWGKTRRNLKYYKAYISHIFCYRCAIFCSGKWK